jgi:hypothetical protein
MNKRCRSKNKNAVSFCSLLKLSTSTLFPSQSLWNCRNREENLETLSFDSQHYAAFGELFMKCLFCCFNEIFNEKLSQRLTQAQKQVASEKKNSNNREKRPKVTNKLNNFFLHPFGESKTEEKWKENIKTISLSEKCQIFFSLFAFYSNFQLNLENYFPSNQQKKK